MKSWEKSSTQMSIGCPSIRFRFAEIIVVRIPLNLLLPEFNKIVSHFSHFSQAEHRLGEDIDFGSEKLISSTVQQACLYPPQVLEINQSYVSGFCLTTDQLFCFSEKLSRCFTKIILYLSKIHVIVFSEMIRCSKSGIHEHSPKYPNSNSNLSHDGSPGCLP